MRNLLLLCLIAICVSIINCSEASAEYVWAYQEEYEGHQWDRYIDTDSIRHSSYYYVTVKFFKDDVFSYDRYYRFDVPNDTVIVEYKDDINSNYGNFMVVKSVPSARAIWHKMKPYMDQKGIYYDRNWDD